MNLGEQSEWFGVDFFQCHPPFPQDSFFLWIWSVQNVSDEIKKQTHTP